MIQLRMGHVGTLQLVNAELPTLGRDAAKPLKFRGISLAYSERNF